ncbi:hypothetical protein SDRG_09710 [Saprolegnia diclina VS20]|uniref:F-box domain-containing protein n=1 Tax=Saprolegnia diclina (strain VS20) TaxID=1156394 RepID=T0RKA2_SAPDV|nr:hypothetical protein SDRG_09710 [Saprolegnia diclina VS20]EQC32738.1 hypothetical protein SDRG_09710 [Saprolegnia diclina VS20]|eukprot:XP_008613882.1 hypothetical protein SDRG_09710 [Saprolegnia diclina VS20]
MDADDCLVIHNVSSLGGFLGRTLPVSLKTLNWNVAFHRVVDNATLEELATAVAHTQLERLDCSVVSQLATRKLLMQTLATTCPHLESLHVDDHYLTRDGATAALTGVLGLPHMTTLTLSMCLLDVMLVLAELVAAGRHLRLLALTTLGRPNDEAEKRATCRALARVHDVPFVLETLPATMGKFVIDALTPRADRHQCGLRL